MVYQRLQRLGYPKPIFHTLGRIPSPGMDPRSGIRARSRSTETVPTLGTEEFDRPHAILSGSVEGTLQVNARGGEIRLAKADRISDPATLNLAGGTFNTGGFSENSGIAAPHCEFDNRFGNGAPATGPRSEPSLSPE